MIPLSCMPGFTRWGRGIEALLERPDAIWVYGDLGSGVSTVGRFLADRRGVACLDDAEGMNAAILNQWLVEHPRGVFASHAAPTGEPVSEVGSHCLALRLESLDEDPTAVEACLESLAAEEGIAANTPQALAALPCPGNLRGLRNRLVRWHLLGQAPEPEEDGAWPMMAQAEDLATNLHFLERVLLHRALRRSFGNRVEAARRLGVSRRQLYLLIARHGDPLRGEIPVHPGPKRFRKRQTNGRPLPDPN